MYKFDVQYIEEECSTAYLTWISSNDGGNVKFIYFNQKEDLIPHSLLRGVSLNHRFIIL